MCTGGARYWRFRERIRVVRVLGFIGLGVEFGRRLFVFCDFA